MIFIFHINRLQNYCFLRKYTNIFGKKIGQPTKNVDYPIYIWSSSVIPPLSLRSGNGVVTV